MNGFFNVYKTCDMTSSDVVVKLRGILRSRTGVRYKVGHLGTLDPMAEGVLPIAVGSATKLFNYMLDKVKVYRATFVWGVGTDTLDASGQVVAEGEKVDDEARVYLAAKLTEGTYAQMPPQYSAKSVGGVRAYDLARKGIEVALEPKVVSIHYIDLIEHEGNAFTFEIECTSGTYVRSICRDIAGYLGTVGHMSALERLRSGEFEVATAHTLDEIADNYAACFMPLEAYAGDLPILSLEESLRKNIDNGVPYPVSIRYPLVRVEVGDTPYGIGTQQDGLLKIICRF